jgi:hypothetical protein
VEKLGLATSAMEDEGENDAGMRQDETEGLRSIGLEGGGRLGSPVSEVEVRFSFSSFSSFFFLR